MADTHLRRGHVRRLPDEVYAALEGADAILHAGDVLVADLIHELGGFAPTYAVLGNNDDAELTAMLPEVLTLDLGGLAVAMIHDSGPSQGRPGRMRRRFPESDLVVYGHSHIPFDGPGAGGQWLLNPGSPTERRAQPEHTFAVLEIADGALVDHRIEVVGR